MVLLLKLLLCLSCVAILVCSTAAASSSCSALKSFFKRRGLQQSDVPSIPSLGNMLRVCPKVNQTCCTTKVEQNFQGLAQKDFDGTLANSIDPTKIFFESQGKKFDEYFKKLIKKSETDLNDMFTKTYGILYKQNSKIFLDLFADLDKYFGGKNLDLTKVMDNFFADLLRKMFQLLNPELTFTSKYLDCVTDYMDSLKPFGEVPQKLSNQIKKAFVAARAFVEGLKIAGDVLSEMGKISGSKSCQASMATMNYCSLCSVNSVEKPCKNYCLTVYRRCFVGWEYINPHWDNYITALDELTEKLEGPFSFEAVVDPIDVKISDAIMNMQDSSLDIKQKVFSGCGSPKGKTKRSVASSSDFFIESPKKRNKRGAASKDEAQPTAGAANLDRLIKAFKTKVKGAKGLWNSMSEAVCTTVSAPAKAQCWNGTAKTIPSTTGVAAKPVLSNQVGDDQIPAVVKKQVSQLKLIIYKLKSAKNGEDVLVEGEGDGYDGSASGSGSGSGNEIPTDSPRTLMPTDGNSVEGGDVFGGGSSDVGARSAALSVRQPTLLALLFCFLCWAALR